MQHINIHQTIIRNWTTGFFAIILLVSCMTTCSRDTAKVYRVGIVSGINTFADITVGFKLKMTEMGYVEGKNITYDVQNLNADPAGERRVVKKFVDEKADLILAFPTGPATAAKAATEKTRIPVVFGVATLEGNDLVQSVRRPGGISPAFATPARKGS